MKSLLAIIRKLSVTEVESFRAFLSHQNGSRRNKKLELFNSLLDKNEEFGYSEQASGNSSSRQSRYQLNKRLKDDLYSFLLSQHHSRDTNDRLFLEMDCHKKLYCFKILIDKGVSEHARQLLDEVLGLSTKFGFHSIYLEAVDLKHQYFPLTPVTSKRRMSVDAQIRSLRKTLNVDLYISQYLSESINQLYDSDSCFRDKLISEPADQDKTTTGSAIVCLNQVNSDFRAYNFGVAYQRLIRFLDSEFNESNAGVKGLFFIDLTKACIGIGNYEEAQKWLNEAENAAGKIEEFQYLLRELHFITNLRMLRLERAQAIISDATRTKKIQRSKNLSSRWAYYALFTYFQKRDYRKVIKQTNDCHILSLKCKSWGIAAKILEILCIFELEDFDWLDYKTDSLRKIVQGRSGLNQRLSAIAGLSRSSFSSSHISPSEIENRIFRIEQQYPWNPLSNELINFCDLMRSACRRLR